MSIVRVVAVTRLQTQAQRLAQQQVQMLARLQVQRLVANRLLRPLRLLRLRNFVQA
jgi:hypothetical protein